MCAIIGSNEPQNIIELIEINSYRGNFSWSVSGINSDYLIEVQEKGFGEFPIKMFLETAKVYSDNSLYWICHVQAPTGGLLKEEDRIHPVELGATQVWHNGVLKKDWIEKAKKEFKTDEDFDTYLIARRLQKRLIENKMYSDVLNDIDGSFACVELRVGEYLRIFRNDASPLFIYGTDISSVQFNGSSPIDSDTVYDIFIDTKDADFKESFDNITKPFFFG